MTIEVTDPLDETFEAGTGADFKDPGITLGSSIAGDYFVVNVTASGFPPGATGYFTFDGRNYSIPGGPVQFQGTQAEVEAWINSWWIYC